MHSWHDVKASRVTPQKFLAMIEISKGSKNKYELDKESGLIILDRILYTSTHYPANYGFIPNTVSGDGEELDAYVLGPTVPLDTFTGYVCAIIHRTDDDDDKLVVVPNGENPTDAEIEEKTKFQEQWFKHVIIRPE